LRISRVNSITSPDINADPPIYYSIWLAAGDDYRLMRYTGLMFSDNLKGLNFGTAVSAEEKKILSKKRSEPLPDSETQSNPRKDFMLPFEGLVPAKYNVEAGLITGEDVTYLQDICRRYSDFQTSAASGTLILSPQYGTSLNNRFHVFEAIAPYMFYRGSMRAVAYGSLPAGVIMPTNPGVSGTIVQDNTHARGNWHTSTTLAGSAEFPWYIPQLFKEVFPTIGNALEPSLVYALTANTRILASTGDDFSVGTLATCPLFVITAL